jgi:hypothetical protein
VNFAYWTSVGCGLVLAVLGTADFVAWLATDLDMLELIGGWIIWRGLLVFAVGIIGLLVFVSCARGRGVPYRRRATWSLLALFVNIPLCFLYVFVAFSMESAITVTITNHAHVSIENLVIKGPNREQVEIRTVRAGEIRHSCPDLKGEGAVEYSLSVDGQPRSGVVIGYMSSPIGRHATLDLLPDLTVRNDESFGRISAADYLRYCVLGYRD